MARYSYHYELFFKLSKRLFQLRFSTEKEAILDTIDYIIDNTDTPYLPDFITDPTFKILANSFVDTFLGGSKKYLADPKDEITKENVNEFIDKIKQEFSDGLDIKDIAIH